MSTFTYSGNSYQIVDTAKTWSEAKSYAESINGYLAIVSSQGENDAIITQALNYISTSNSAGDGGNSRYVWLGGSDIETEGTFKWVDGTLVSGYSNWGSGFLTEPDNYLGQQDALAMALEQWPAAGGGIGTAGKWNDIDENNLMYFVVEFNPTSLESASTATLSDSYLNLQLTGTAKINGTGNALNNTLTGNLAANNLAGLAGNDTLDGGVGIDTLVGGVGNDTYYVDAAKDIVTENTNEGTDTVIASFTFTIGKDIEQLILSGSVAINGNGNALANSISGNAAANSINGAAGNDSISSGDGSDTIIGGAGDDTIYAEGGNDTVTTTSGIDWVYGGDGNDKITGSKDEDHLEGNDGNDSIVGAAGNDALWGSGGNDSIKGDAGVDHIWGGTGNDTLSGGAGIDRFHFGETALSSSNADTITDFKGDEIYLYSNPFTNHNFISVTLLSDAHSGEGIIYEKSTGTLYYDNDGAGFGEAGTAFAILTGKPTILLTNFVF
jgi:Ca2+-binding RTX toxin-like protein